MQIDRYGQIIFNENDLCELYLKKPTDLKLKRTLVDKHIDFTRLELNDVPEIVLYSNTDIPITDFDNICQNDWQMPVEYKNLDIAKYVLDQCKNDSELQRAGQELLLYQERNLFDLLKYLKYLVDTMRTNNIVYGVGRGSSVSSFVLYLIGIHRINSLYYDLDIREFLK